MIFALEECLKWNWRPPHIFTDYAGIVSILRNFQASVVWRLKEKARQLQHLFSYLQNPGLDLIGQEKNTVVDQIVFHAHHSPERFPLSQRNEAPFWLYQGCSRMGISF